MAKKGSGSKKASKKGAAKQEEPAEPPEDPYSDLFDGPMTRRRFGLRVDDDVIVYIVGGDLLRVVQGRVLEHKKGLHLVDDDGYYHRISYDWVTDIIVLRHNRPAPGEDPELRKKPAGQPKQKAQPQTAETPTDQAYQ